jgi:hypothetical protein
LFCFNVFDIKSPLNFGHSRNTEARHVCASYSILYRKRLCIGVAARTVYHVLKQQYGIARGVCRLPDWAFNLLLGLSVAAGLTIYLGIFLLGYLALMHYYTEAFIWKAGSPCRSYLAFTK